MTNVFFLLFGGLQGLLLAFLCWRKQKGLAGFFFITFLLLATLQIFLKVVAKTWLMDHLQGLYKIGYELPFLFGPVLYLFFFTSYKTSNKWRSTWAIHFVPFVIFALIRSLNIYYFHYHPQVDSWHALVLAFHPIVGWKMWLHMGLQWISLWGYSWASLQVIRHSTQKHQWHFPFIWITLVIESLIILALKLMTLYYGHYADPRWLFLSLTLLIYWLSYQVLASAPIQVSPLPSQNKYAKSKLPSTRLQQIIQQLKAYMEAQQPHLDPELTIDKLSNELKLPKHHLSQAINSEMQQNFSDFLNAYRINTAKSLLRDSSKNHLTIAAIAYDAGFKSLSHFNSTFKKSTHIPPSIFRKRVALETPTDLSDKEQG